MGKLIPNPDNDDLVFTKLDVGDWAFVDNDTTIFVRLPVPDGHYSNGIHFLPISKESRFLNAAGTHWDWDGNREAPTLTPSILCNVSGWHGYLTKGVLVEV